MTMLSELKFTDARNNLTSLYNKVYNDGQPVIVKRRQTEEVLLLRTDLQKLLLDKYVFKPEVLHEDDGSVTLALDNLELYANGKTIEEAAQALVQDLKLYACDYIQRSQLFLNAPNRRSHFPYVLRVLLCNSDEEIRRLLQL